MLNMLYIVVDMQASTYTIASSTPIFNCSLFSLSLKRSAHRPPPSPRSGLNRRCLGASRAPSRPPTNSGGRITNHFPWGRRPKREAGPTNTFFWDVYRCQPACRPAGLPARLHFAEIGKQDLKGRVISAHIVSGHGHRPHRRLG